MNKENLINKIEEEIDSNHALSKQYARENKEYWQFYQGRVDAYRRIIELLEKSPEKF